MLTQDLDQLSVQYLSEILMYENISRDELIKSLLRDRWMSLQAEMSPPPRRKNSRETIAEFVRKKSAQPVNRESYASR